MIKIEKIYPRDIIAFFVLMFSLFLMYMGINSLVSGIVIMIITFYFSKRLYEERNPNGDLNKVIHEIKEDINAIPKANSFHFRPHLRSEPKDHGKYHHNLKPDSNP